MKAKRKQRKAFPFFETNRFKERTALRELALKESIRFACFQRKDSFARACFQRKHARRLLVSYTVCIFFESKRCASFTLACYLLTTCLLLAYFLLFIFYLLSFRIKRWIACFQKKQAKQQETRLFLLLSVCLKRKESVRISLQINLLTD